MLQLENGNIFILLQPFAVGRRLVAGFFGFGLGGKPDAFLPFFEATKILSVFISLSTFDVNNGFDSLVSSFSFTFSIVIGVFSSRILDSRPKPKLITATKMMIAAK